MDHDLWKVIVGAAKRAVKRIRRRLGPEVRVHVSTYQVVLMYCWQVAHDRPMSWACDRRHYGGCFRPRRLLSVSQYTRRVKAERTQQVLQALHDELARGEAPSVISYFDGKLLPVAMHSHDADATKVRTNAGYVRGYRLHAWTRSDGRIGVWSVTGAHAGEQTVACGLCQHLPALPPDAWILGDVRFDSAPLYRAVALRGASLLTPLQAISRTPSRRREMGPRLAAVQAWEHHAGWARLLLRQRLAIERTFSQLCTVPGGLAPLPAWVRHQDRVVRWVGAKIILHNARISLRTRKKDAA